MPGNRHFCVAKGLHIVTMKSNKRSNGILRIAYALVAVVIIVIVVGFCMPKKKECIQGEVETTDYRVSSKVPARVAKLYVHEGDNVKKGDTLVVMEAPDIMAKLSEANAAHSAAEAIELEAQHGTRQEQIQSAYAMWEKAKAGLVVAEKTYQRVVHLYDEGVLPAQKRDEAQAQYDAMRATEQAARSQYEMAVNGARNEDKMAAAAQVSRAKGAVDEVSSYVNETILTASADGEVSEIFPEVGELVGTGAPIMNINVLDDVTCGLPSTSAKTSCPGYSSTSG